MTSTAIIVTTYQWPQALDLVLASAAVQKVKPDEMHVADDGSGSETAAVIEQWQNRLPFPLHHHWHEDKGFRPNPVRNEAIANCHSELVIMVDGDMILHPWFVADHRQFARPKHFIQSRRVRLDDSLTANLLRERRHRISSLERGVQRRMMAMRSIPFARLMSSVDTSFRHIRGANMSFWRDDLITVNGFNEDFIGWGFEDHDLTARLYHAGLNRSYLRHAGIAYHLEHADNSRDRKSLNETIYEATLEQRVVYCPNGLAENHRILRG